MVVVNTQGQEINAKIVYYGPALSGKTTNLEQIYDRMPSDAKGKMVSMKTRTDRTLFFDFLPIELGDINGYRTRMLLYTVPGQVYYNATRKLVLKGADAVVFVADSSPAKLAENIESLRNLEENLNELGLTLDTLPWVIQYNKRDLHDAVPVKRLESELNLLRVPSFEAVATQGQGVYETFRGIAGLLFTQLANRLVAAGAPGARRTVGIAPETNAAAPEAAYPAPEMRLAPQPVDPLVSRVVEDGLREIDRVAASAAGAEAARPGGSTVPYRAADAGPRNVEERTAPLPSAEGQGDEAFRFVCLETAPIDESVGRVLDLDRDSEARSARSRSSGADRDFITDPCRTNEPEERDNVAESISPVAAVSLAERPSQAEEECVITVPVLLTRSQTRKTIPIKLRLDVQIMDEER